MKMTTFPLISLLIGLHAPIFSQNPAENNTPKQSEEKIFGDPGVMELGGRLDFSYNKERTGTAAVETGNLLLAPQLGYFFIKNVEISAFPTWQLTAEKGRETQSSIGALLGLSYTNFYARPVFPYVEILGGGLQNKTANILAYGLGIGLKIELFTHCLLKTGVSYVHEDKTARISGFADQQNDRVALSLSFGIFL